MASRFEADPAWASEVSTGPLGVQIEAAIEGRSVPRPEADLLESATSDGTDTSPLSIATMLQCPQLTRILLARGADPNLVTNGRSDIAFAARLEQWDIVRAMAEAGGDVESGAAGDPYSSALSRAASSADVSTLQSLASFSSDSSQAMADAMRASVAANAVDNALWLIGHMESPIPMDAALAATEVVTDEEIGRAVLDDLRRRPPTPNDDDRSAIEAACATARDPAQSPAYRPEQLDELLTHLGEQPC